ncbi:hypothetical protein B0H14DRAFT_2605508 [Mycena olivaceomarginata]|nr:hypothetical protein B0H14DRAFT_2605508 [Mycena olivaceomarginata]
MSMLFKLLMQDCEGTRVDGQCDSFCSFLLREHLLRPWTASKSSARRDVFYADTVSTQALDPSGEAILRPKIQPALQSRFKWRAEAKVTPVLPHYHLARNTPANANLITLSSEPLSFLPGPSGAASFLCCAEPAPAQLPELLRAGVEAVRCTGFRSSGKGEETRQDVLYTELSHLWVTRKNNRVSVYERLGNASTASMRPLPEQAGSKAKVETAHPLLTHLGSGDTLSAGRQGLGTLSVQSPDFNPSGFGKALTILRKLNPSVIGVGRVAPWCRALKINQVMILRRFFQLGVILCWGSLAGERASLSIMAAFTNVKGRSEEVETRRGADEMEK